MHHIRWACMSTACTSQQKKPLQREACTMTKSSPRSLQLEKAGEQQWRLGAPIKKKKSLFGRERKLLHPPTLHWPTQVIRPKPKPVKWAWDFFSGRRGMGGERINNANKEYTLLPIIMALRNFKWDLWGSSWKQKSENSRKAMWAPPRW